MKLFASGKQKAGEIGPPLWVFMLVYALLSVLMTWPLVSQLNSHVPTPDSDVFNVYWGNWWVRHALGNGQNPYFTEYLIYPQGFDLVSFAFSPFLALLWIPLSWILPPLAAYNLLLLVTILLCCLAMHQLVHYLTGNAWASMGAGITFGFAPALVAERMPHLNLSALFWIPWAVLILTRLMREAKIRDAILLALVLALAFLTRLQVGVLAMIFAGVYFVGLALAEGKTWHRLALGRLLLSGLVFLLLVGPFLISVWQSMQQPGGASLTRGGAEGYQTDLLAYVMPMAQNPLFGSWTEDLYEQTFAVNEQYWAYLGFVPLLLGLYAAASRPRKALPWLLAGFFFFVLALGPVLRVNGEVYPDIKLPYGWATGLFSAIGFNWPNRFNLALMVAVSALVGIACALMSERPGRAWLVGLVVVVILAEYLVVPWPTIFPPPHSTFYDQMAADEEMYAIVDFPLTRSDGEIHRYYQTIHHKPIVGGWDHRVPDSALDFIASNPLLSQWLADDQSRTPLSLDGALMQLSETNIRYIVVHKSQLKTIPESMRALLGTLKPVFQDWSILVLSVADASNEAYNVVQWFGEDLGLVQPTAFLHLPWDGRPPLLHMYVCWLGGERGDLAYRVTLTGPEGLVVYDEAAPLPSTSEGLVCETPQLEISPPLAAGEYTVGITPFLAGRSLGTYTTTQPIHILQTRDGTEFPAMGVSSPMAFDAPMELLGYNVMEGDRFLWTDVFLRSSERHGAAYLLSMELLDPATGTEVAQAQNTIPEHQWKRGELYQERQILWFGDVIPGQYSLRIVLQDMLAPGHDVEPSPGEVVDLEIVLAP
ncbi:MAG: hypothetical protein ACK2UC_01370 [Anaerolineae bacterium]|jgi:hypothetical protein